jgi:hypothetical protein
MALYITATAKKASHILFPLANGWIVVPKSTLFLRPKRKGVRKVAFPLLMMFEDTFFLPPRGECRIVDGFEDEEGWSGGRGWPFIFPSSPLLLLVLLLLSVYYYSLCFAMWWCFQELRVRVSVAEKRREQLLWAKSVRKFSTFFRLAFCVLVDQKAPKQKFKKNTKSETSKKRERRRRRRKSLRRHEKEKRRRQSKEKAAVERKKRTRILSSASEKKKTKKISF